MHAVRHCEFGGPDTLRLEAVEDPVPGMGQVRIAVAVAGVHLIATRIRQGTFFGAGPPPSLPMTPGRKVAGVVDAVGPGVDGSWLGRPVVGPPRRRQLLFPAERPLAHLVVVIPDITPGVP